MAVQTTPHTNTDQDSNSAAMDLEPNMNPQDPSRGEDAKLYENADGAQTGGTRSFHASNTRDDQPNAIDEGTSLTGGNGSPLPTGDGQGVTNSAPSKERATQEKVINS